MSYLAAVHMERDSCLPVEHVSRDLHAKDLSVKGGVHALWRALTLSWAALRFLWAQSLTLGSWVGGTVLMHFEKHP